MDAGPEMVGQVYTGAGGSLLVECCALIIIRLVQVAYWGFLGALLSSGALSGSLKLSSSCLASLLGSLVALLKLAISPTTLQPLNA